MKDIEKLLARYYEGETTLDEEKQLRAYFQSGSFPKELQSHQAQFRMMTELQEENPSFDTNQWVNETLLSTHPVKGKVLRVTWGWQIAASVGLLLLGFAGGFGVHALRKTDPPPVIAVASPQSLEVKKVLHFDQLSQTSASERIRAVNQTYDLSQTDQEITQLLINTMNFDENVNVRLAAGKALFRFRNEPGVREALIQSMKIQTDPNMQILLIEMLVEIKEKRAVEEMRRLLQDKNVMKVVKLKAEQGIGLLI